MWLLGSCLHFANVESSYCVGLEHAPQLPVLDLCQEAEMLLSRFKASLKAGITREGLSFFSFSPFPLLWQLSLTALVRPEWSWVLNQSWRVESYSFCDGKDSLQCSFFFLLPHCSSVVLQFDIAVLHNCVLNKISELFWILECVCLEFSLMYSNSIGRNSSKSLKGINKIPPRDLCLISVCSSAFSKLVLHTKCEELNNVILSNCLILKWVVRKLCFVSR